MAEADWNPLLGVAGAIVLGIPFLVWRNESGGWLPPLAYAVLAGVAAWWLHRQATPRTVAAFLVAAAMWMAWIMPIGTIFVEEPIPE